MEPGQHASDCAVHNEPAMPNGPCDCGAVPAPQMPGDVAALVEGEVMEPTYIAQTAEPMTSAEAMAWISSRIDDARNAGAPFWRATRNDEGWTLVEAWPEWPADQGEPRWQVAVTKGEK